MVKKLVKIICENHQLPYFTFSPTFSICPNHGYLKGECDTCERCNATCEIYSRVVGFLTPTHRWNDGKKAEFGMRSTFNVESALAS